MKSHVLHAVVMNHGAATRVEKEMGMRSNGRNAGRWRREVRPEHGQDSTGRPSPLVRAKQELLAHDRVDPRAAEVLFADFHASIQIQRARRAGLAVEKDGRQIACALIESAAEAAKAVLGLTATQEEAEIKVALAGGTILRARMFVEGSGPDNDTPQAISNQSYRIAA